MFAQYLTAHPLISTGAVVSDSVRFGWAAFIEIAMTHRTKSCPQEYEIWPCQLEESTNHWHPRNFSTHIQIFSNFEKKNKTSIPKALHFPVFKNLDEFGNFISQKDFKVSTQIYINCYSKQIILKILEYEYLNIL